MYCPGASDCGLIDNFPIKGKIVISANDNRQWRLYVFFEPKRDLREQTAKQNLCKSKCSFRVINLRPKISRSPLTSLKNKLLTIRLGLEIETLTLRHDKNLFCISNHVPQVESSLLPRPLYSILGFLKENDKLVIRLCFNIYCFISNRKLSLKFVKVFVLPILYWIAIFLQLNKNIFD